MKKRILSAILVICICMTLLPITVGAAAPSGYTTDEHGIMAYGTKTRNTSAGYSYDHPTIDIQGYHNNGWKPTTYSNHGYVYKTSGSGMSDATIDQSASFVNGGRYIKLSYTVTANSTITNGKLGIYADIKIGSADSAPISLIYAADGTTPIGMKMTEGSSEGAAQFNLFFSNTSGVTDCTTYWLGGYGSADDKVFETATITNYSGDSGFAVSWQNINLNPGQNETFSIIVGVGKTAEPIRWGNPAVTMADTVEYGGKLDVSASVIDEAGMDDTLYCNIDGGQEIQIGEAQAVSGTTSLSGQIDFAGVSAGDHTVSFWVVNGDGSTTTVENKTVTVLASPVNEYTITFLNEDGTVLQSSEVASGETPVYAGPTPTKAGNAQHSYTFAGWDNTIAPVSGPATYTATFTEALNQYTITFLNEDGTVLQSGDVAFGDTPVYAGATPAKPATVQYTYTFSGWDKAIDPVSGQTTYTATFTETVNKYTVTYIDGVNGSAFNNQEYTVDYGTVTPAFRGIPKRFSYKFVGWEPEVSDTVTNHATYEAQWALDLTWILALGENVKVKGLNTEDHVAYVVGRGDYKFAPTGTVTRAEAATMFFRLLSDDFRATYWDDSASYADVADTAWYNVAIATLEEAGVIKDTDFGANFRPNEPITRAEMAVMAAQFCTMSSAFGSNTFADVPYYHWAAREIALVQYVGWIQGYNGNYRPEDTITRAECVTIINRMLERGVEAENMLPGMVTFVDVSAGAWYYEAVQEAANSHTYNHTNWLMTNEQFYGEQWLTIEKATDWATMEQLWATTSK